MPGQASKATPGPPPWPLRLVERFIAVDYRRVRANHALLAALARRDDVTVFSAHDPVEFARLRAG